MRPLFLSAAASVFLAIAACPAAFAANQRPTAAESGAWVREHAVPIQTVEAGHGFADLEPLRAMIGDARVVALGEQTHGSREVFQMKHRLVEFLVSEMGFTVFAIEANMPEAARVNDFVAEGHLNPQELIRGMRFWTWQTEEVRAMVEWMREFNRAERARGGKRSVAFTGFDMQDPTAAAAGAHDFVAAHLPNRRIALETAMRNLAAARTAGTGFANGRLPVEKLRGHHFVISGWIKTTGVSPDGWAGLWCSTNAGGSAPAIFKNTSSQSPHGTTGWKRYELALDIPPKAISVMFGLMLQGSGQAWFDDLTFTVDETPIAPEEIDAGFEGATITGFPLRSETGYEVALAQDAHSGQQSLRIAGTGSDATAAAEQSWTELAQYLGAWTPPQPDANASRDAAWAARQARLVVQWCVLRRETSTRDAAMAENVLWLLAQDPKAKIILWAHNGHVARRDDAMGGALDRALGSGMFVLGFATGSGTYRAVVRGAAQPSAATLARPPYDSVEAALTASGLARAIIDLRPCRESGDARARWFIDDHAHRSIGWGVIDDQFKPRAIARDYDALLWIERTSASVPMQ